MINEIYRAAKRAGACRPSLKVIKQADIAVMVDEYFSNSDWSFENDFPKIDMLRKYFTDSQRDGFFVDYQGKIDPILDVAVFGDSNASLKYCGFEVAQVFVRHNSRLTLEATGNALVNVYLEDNGLVAAYVDHGARVVINQFGGRVEGRGNYITKRRKWQGK